MTSTYETLKTELDRLSSGITGAQTAAEKLQRYVAMGPTGVAQNDATVRAEFPQLFGERQDTAEDTLAREVLRLKDAVATKMAAISGAHARLAEVETELVSITQQRDDHYAEIQRAQEIINDLRGRVEKAEGALSELQARIDAAQASAKQAD